MDRLTPNKGQISRNGNLRIGHFTQHSADKFNLQLSAVENMLNIFEKADDQGMRSWLGKFQIQGTDALKPMMMLSGGQKSRVAFASLAYQQPHVIVMDEPVSELISSHLFIADTSSLFQANISLCSIFRQTTWIWRVLMPSSRQCRTSTAASLLLVTTNTLLPPPVKNYGSSVMAT